MVERQVVCLRYRSIYHSHEKYERDYSDSPGKIRSSNIAIKLRLCEIHTLSTMFIQTPNYRNAILQSASVFSPWALLSTNEMKRRAMKLADIVGCGESNVTESLSDVVSCLTQYDAQVQ